MDFKLNFNKTLDLFRAPEKTFLAIKKKNELDVAQLIIYVIASLVISLIVSRQIGITSLITTIISVGLSAFVGGAFLLLIMIIAGGKATYLQVVNVSMYLGVIQTVAGILNIIPFLGAILVFLVSIYCIYLDIKATIIIGDAPTKRTYITYACLMGGIIILGIIGIAIVGAVAFLSAIGGAL